MSRFTLALLVGLSFSGALWLNAAPALAVDRSGTAAAAQVEPSLKATNGDQVRQEALAWLKQNQVDEARLKQFEQQWTSSDTLDLLERLVRGLALGDGRVAALVERCAHPAASGKLPDVAWLGDPSVSTFVQHNLRLYYGRWLTQERLYDEASEHLRALNPDQIVDPSALLFYQSVVHHRLLEKEAGLRALDRLLADVADVPHRFRALAKLMKVDLQELDDKTLDHIARRMDDIRRRLDLGRAGEKVVKIEDGVIESLDKLIDELEKQQQQQQQGGGGGRGMNPRPSSPMDKSQIGQLKGPGEVDRKRIGNSAGWGDLPPKQREEAMQQIGKDFPAHYRDVIEQYFRKLATEPRDR